MYYGLVHFPELRNQNLKNIREKYDPWFDKIAEHITFIFPVPCYVGLKNISEHITSKVAEVNSFECHFHGFKKSWDHFLLWTPDTGRDEIIELYNKFYTGILEPYHRKDIPFEPHIALGLFAKGVYDPGHPAELELDSDLFQNALNDLQNSGLDELIIIDKVTLLEFDNTFSKFKEVEEFILKT